MTTTKRTLDWCKERSYTAQVVERWNAFAKRRIDLFGFVDLVFVTGEPNSGITGVQCCATASLSARRDKIIELFNTESKVTAWLKSGNSVEIHAWAKRGARGKRKVWTLLREIVVLSTDAKELYFNRINGIDNDTGYNS